MSAEMAPGAEQPVAQPDQAVLLRLSALLAQSNILPEDVEQIEGLQVSNWEVVTKNNEGEAEVTQLHGTRARLKTKSAQKRRLADYLSQADPVLIPPVELNTVEEDAEIERIMVVPDIQAGFRRYADGTLEPTHSEESVDIMLQLIRDTQPDRIVLNGDNLDFPTLGRHEQEHFFQNTLKPSINYVHGVLALMRSAAPNAAIVYLAGNHEQRLEKYIAQKAPELYDLVQAGSDERMLTVPFLLNLKKLGIEYRSGYPANEYYLSDKLKIIHGTKAKSNTSTVAGLARTESESVIQGHSHRAEIAAYTRKRSRFGKVIGDMIMAASFGTLASIVGRVPSYGSAVDNEGRPVTNIENWQNAMGYVELCRATGDVALMQTIHIRTFDEQRPFATRFNGKTYLPRRKFVAAESYQPAALPAA
ncbi:MAG TPA: metallophosphoesterase [Candidatus Saccharimonadales bacterium]|nr:metallophosphoesterase [Candidatus Saccharimonadales bacterium]